MMTSPARNNGKHPGGAPSIPYDKEIAKKICLEIACSDRGVTRICKSHKEYPSYDTVYRWLFEEKEFGEMYALAKKAQIEVLVDQIIEIGDDSTRDTITDENGNERCNSEWINRSRLRIDNRKWLAGKLAPKIYGNILEAITLNIGELTKATSEVKKEYGREY